jgi:hypothetical protein
MVSPVQLASVPPLEVAHRKDRIELGRVGSQPLDREPVAVGTQVGAHLDSSNAR